MIDIPVGTAMLAGTGMRFLGGLMGGGGGGKAARQQLHHQMFLDKQARDWNLDRVREERAREDTLVQRRVADAKAAGLHPLYALGASSGGSPSFSVGSGSAVAAAPGGRSNAMEAAGEALQQYGQYKADSSAAKAARSHNARVRELQLRTAETRLSREQLELYQAQQSAYAREKQAAGHTGLGVLRNVDPTQPDAEDVEQRLGEAGGFVQGLTNVFRDWWARRLGPAELERLDKLLPSPRGYDSPRDKQLVIRIRKALGGRQ